MGFKETFLSRMQFLADETEARYAKKGDISEYSVKKAATAEDGYAATYHFTKDGVPVGDAINVLKDYTVKDVNTGYCTEAGVPVEGLGPGDKYIDFIVNTADGKGEEKHLYLAAKDITVKCTGGNGIEVDASGEVSLKLDASRANGLSAGKAGLALALATAEAAGAMSAEDKGRLDKAVTEGDLETITAEEIRALFASQQPEPETPGTE